MLLCDILVRFGVLKSQSIQEDVPALFHSSPSYKGIPIAKSVFPGGSDGKESARNAGDLGSIPGLGRSPGEGNGKPFQYSCLENPMDRGPWWVTAHGVTKSNFTFP